jgi:energy-coupling factor transporter ATP-binding protein EcfA2
MTTAPAQPLAFAVIAPRSGDQAPVALTSAMHSLVLDARHPLALEIAGTPTSKAFLVRATTPEALAHATSQMRARYPQAEAVPLLGKNDPFRLEDGEAVSCVELAPGAAAYLPLRTLDERERRQEGSDPLLGLLAALDHLPTGARTVAQLALVPAPPQWSAPYRRRAIEHALEPERQQQAATRGRGTGPSWGSILLLALALLAILLLQHVPSLVPAWVLHDFGQLLHGNAPQFTASQRTQLLVGGAVLVISVFFLYVLYDQIKKRFFPKQTLYDQRLVAEQTKGAAYRVRLRLYVISPDTLKAEAEQRQHVLAQLAAAYRQFHLAAGGYFVVRPCSARKARQFVQGAWGQDVTRSLHLLNMEAVASLWHLPAASMLSSLALVESRGARSSLIPPAVARASGPIIGASAHAGYEVAVPLPSELLTLHTLVAGKTGEGKSTFLEHLAQAAMEQGGLVVIDPHGDLAEHVLRLVPAHRADDVVLVDLADANYAVGLNPLDVTLGRERDKAVSDLLKTLSHIWATSWGPRMENAFRAALRTLFEANRVLVARDAQQGPYQQYTLLDVLPVLTRESFCHALLSSVTDPYLHRWWREYYEPLNLYMQRDIINPVINKTTTFESTLARRIVGQSCSTLNFSALIREQKIVLVKLAKGVVGEDVAALLGATLLGLLQTTLEEQGALAEQKRVKLLIILDEFQVLAGVDYGALAELRKYGATFALATQSLEYLHKRDPVLLPTVLANVKHLTLFQLSAKDAFTMHEEVGVEQADLVNLDPRMCYARWTVGVQRQPTFSLMLYLPPLGAADQAERIRLRSQQRYGVPVALVESRLEEALARTSAQGQRGRPPRGAMEVEEAMTPSASAPSQVNSGTRDKMPPPAPARPPKKSGRGRWGTHKKAAEPRSGGITPMEWPSDAHRVREVDPPDDHSTQAAR